MNYIRRYGGFCIVLLLSFFAVIPFFQSGFFPMHDNTQVQRVYEMKKALSDGMFPVRWVPDLGYGYGYPIFNFYAPLAYYAGGFINLIGFDSLIATKVMMIVGILLAGVFMYLFAKQFWGEAGGIASGLLYVYAPYHAVDIYVRGDVAEFFAYAFIPLVFYSLWKVYEENKKRYIMISCLSFAGIILSHNLTAFIVTPFIFIYGLILFIRKKYHKKNHGTYNILISLIIGILLASFYWLPALSEMQLTNVLSQIGGGADYKDHFVCLSQIWNSPWGYGGSIPGCIDGMSFKIGKLHVILSLFSLASLYFLLSKSKTRFIIVIFSIISLLLSIFFMLNYSKFIWDKIPQMAILQYPWRFLVPASFFISFLSGAGFLLALKLARSNKRLFIPFYILNTLVIIFIVYFNMKVFLPEIILNGNVNDYINNIQLKWTTSGISDEYMPKYFIKPKTINEIPSSKISVQGDSARIVKLIEKTQFIETDIHTSRLTQIVFNTAYYPAWHAFIDGKEIAMTPFNSGYKINLPIGSHKLVFKFIQTPVEVFADFLSIAGVIILLGISYTGNKSYKYKKQKI